MKTLMLIAISTLTLTTSCKKEIKPDPQQNKIYYARIKQVDKDGKVTYSTVKVFRTN